MNDSRLDLDTTERMLRGEATGPSELAALLAAASARLTTEDLNGEEAAVAAFRAAYLVREQSRRGLFRRPLTGVKVVVAAFVVTLASGITVMAATSYNLPGGRGNPHPSAGTHAPMTSRTDATHSPPQAPSRHSTGPARPGGRKEGQRKHSLRPAESQKSPHPAKGPKSGQNNTHIGPTHIPAPDSAGVAASPKTSVPALSVPTSLTGSEAR